MLKKISWRLSSLVVKKDTTSISEYSYITVYGDKIAEGSLCTHTWPCLMFLRITLDLLVVHVIIWVINLCNEFDLCFLHATTIQLSSLLCHAVLYCILCIHRVVLSCRSSLSFLFVWVPHLLPWISASLRHKQVNKPNMFTKLSSVLCLTFKVIMERGKESDIEKSVCTVYDFSLIFGSSPNSCVSNEKHYCESRFCWSFLLLPWLFVSQLI